MAKMVSVLISALFCYKFVNNATINVLAWGFMLFPAASMNFVIKVKASFKTFIWGSSISINKIKYNFISTNFLKNANYLINLV